MKPTHTVISAGIVSLMFVLAHIISDRIPRLLASSHSSTTERSNVRTKPAALIPANPHPLNNRTLSHQRISLMKLIVAQ